MSTNMSLLTQLWNFWRAPLGNLDTPVDEYEDDEEDDDEDYWWWYIMPDISVYMYLFMFFYVFILLNKLFYL